MRKMKNVIPEVVVRRLPRYYRLLSELKREGKDRISSSVISTRLNITASQVRQDFSHFGAFGLQGYGYDVDFLKEEIKSILGLDKTYNVVIIGAGHIGKALAHYKKFGKQGINILAVFDIVTEGIDLPDINVLHIDTFREFAKENKIDIAVVTTQGEVAEELAKTIKECEIPAIWNFSHFYIQSDKKTAVENINLNESMFTLIYLLNNLDNN